MPGPWLPLRKSGTDWEITRDEGLTWELFPSTYDSAGFCTHDILIDNGDGTLTLPTLDVYLFNNDSYHNTLQRFRLPGGTTGTNFVDIPNLVTSYIVADYNYGDARFDIITNVDLINESNVLPYYTLYRDGNSIIKLSWNSMGCGLTNKLHQRLVKTDRFSRESGILIREVPTRIVTITSGKTWNGGHQLSLDSFSSDTDYMCIHHHTAGVWDRIVVTQYNNFYYDDGTDLVELGNNKWVVNWVYSQESENSAGCILLSPTQYNSLAAAQLEQPPVSAPDVVVSHAILAGRIIVQKNATSGTVETSFGIKFSPSGIMFHNDLSNLQGGTLTEYYHLDASDYSEMISGTKKLTEQVDPADPPSNTSVMWQTSVGDIKIKINHGGIVKTATLVDYSSLP